jgi:uncharacterized protein YdhG (YjbR/CyaY superfamily)
MAATGTDGWSPQERAAMKARAAEIRDSGERGAKKAASDLEACLAAIADMAAGDRRVAERVHAVVTEAVPALAPRTFYGQPAYALDGKVLCFFRSGTADDSRYCSFGVNPQAQLDDGLMWPTSWALTGVDAATEQALVSLVRRAAGVS